MALEPSQAVRLARVLKQLRESHWAGVDLTQAQLANALSREGRVASATISSWESVNNPKTPTAARLNAYARFFATRRSLEPQPHLLAEDELDDDEIERFRELEGGLLDLVGPQTRQRNLLSFDDGPIVVICPEAPPEDRAPLGRDQNPNLNKLDRYADLDALIEVFGHLRASNPALSVFHRLPSEVVADDLSTHVVLVGGIGWNKVTKRFQDAMHQVPVRQVEVPDIPTGEIFTVAGQDDSSPQKFLPEWEAMEPGDQPELIEDVGFLARLPNPFRISRTLTICNGVHSRGVLGAVRCLTDARVRESNEQYLASRFPDGRFALLLRVPVVATEALSPDLQNPRNRLFEWAPEAGRSS